MSLSLNYRTKFIQNTIEVLNTSPKNLTVGMVNMGTYPHYSGGVSTWCDSLIHGLSDIQFKLINLVPDLSVKPVYKLPPNVVDFMTIPLWGTSEVLELQRNLSLRQIIRKKRSAPVESIQTFVPYLRHFLQILWGDDPAPAELGKTLQEMAIYFMKHDYDTTMRSEPVWRCFMEENQKGYARFMEASDLPDTATLLDITNAMRLLYRWFTVLTISIPKVDVWHVTAAGLCSIPGIIARQIHNTPLLLTEHGIYLRERLLALTREDSTPFDQAFQARFDQRIVEATYYYADRITPVSDYNKRWALKNGASNEQIQTIYNGTDPKQYTPVFDNRSPDDPPTIIWLGRIDPLKDVLTLIRAAAIVHKTMPEARFVLYGSAPKGNEAYYESCLSLRSELGVDDAVIFAGFTSNPSEVYVKGDFVVLSSISEGFPYTIVEAMMCGRTVVGTAVGGVPEALENCGMVVEPRNPQAMADACLHLLQNPSLAKSLGQQAREIAVSEFSLEQCTTSYGRVYQQLSSLRRPQIYRNRDVQSKVFA